MEEKKTSVFEHLQELRRRIIISAAVLFVGMICSYLFFRENMLNIVFGPLYQLGLEPVVIGVAEGFMVQLKLALLGGFVLTSPIIIWQTLGFIIPAFYKHERKLFWFSFFSSLFLFIGGIYFGYFVVLEPSLRVLLVEFTQDFAVMLSVGRYVSFFILFLLPFGLIFQMPLAACLLGRLGLITPSLLREKRKYVILAIFILAAVLSPGGDILAQVLFALPMLVLFEISILVVALTTSRSDK